MQVIFASLLAVVFSVQVSTRSAEECIDGPSTWYKGNRSITASGRTCQRWDTDKPHKPKRVPKDGGHHNYCRNPVGDIGGTWCYTTDIDKRWEFCNISKCPDDSLVIWTNYNSRSQSTQLMNIQADPEIVKQETDSTGTFNVSVLTKSNLSHTEYWALAADYKHQQLYFTDHRQDYLGVWDMVNNTTEKYIQGMAHGIENIAFDWVTNNLYWTDSKFKWVMAADHTFTYYTPVYITAPDVTYGLSLHSVKRLLIFSTYKTMGAKIIVTDLAGKNPKELFKYPDVFDVTGITIDYTDDRLYWTDFTGFGGRVLSSRLDGSNKTQFHFSKFSSFWGVAPYLDYIYVSDIRSFDGLYTIGIISKSQKRVFGYKFAGRPRGIAVYSRNEQLSLDTPPSSGECKYSDECSQLCLPRIDAKRVCACSLGYHLDEVSQKCRSKLVHDNYFLIADRGQQKIFQIPINNSASHKTLKYSIVPITPVLKAEAVAVDDISNSIYWSEKQPASINKASIDGSQFKKIASSFTTSIIVDPFTSHLFYIDTEENTIMVATKDGSSSRTIVTPDPSKSNMTSIRMITQDIKYKYIYWTDTFSKVGEGQVLRCRYDGSGKEVVLDKLSWPHAITIDYETMKLYVVEAKIVSIYEVDLSELIKINNTSPKQKIYKLYHALPHIERLFNYVIDFKVHQGMAYIIEENSGQLLRYNLTKGVSSLEQYGPNEFFRLSSLAVNSKNFFAKFIRTHNDPCKNTNCRQICVAIDTNRSKCLCEDGKLPVGNVCIQHTSGVAETDIIPPVSKDCPENIKLSLLSCAATLTYTWADPTWKDDQTNPEDITVTSMTQKSPLILGAGHHEFSYIAKDKYGNVGYCRWTVRVLDNQCPPVSKARPGMIRSNPSCDNRVGSYYNISCRTEGYVVWVIDGDGKRSTAPIYEVTCSNDLIWTEGRTQNLDCRPPPTNASKSGQKKNKTDMATGPQNNKGGLSEGAIAAIVILAIVLIVVIAVVALILVRRGSPILLRHSFPLFWKSSEDTADLQANDNN